MMIEEIIENKNSFRKITWKHLSNAFNAFENDEFML